MDHLTKTHHYDECTHWCALLELVKEQACALNPANTHRQTHFTVIYTQHMCTDARTHSHALSISHQAPYLIIIHARFLRTPLTGLRSYPTWESLTGAYMKEPFQHSSHQHTHTHISAGGSGLVKETPCFSNRYFCWIRESVPVSSVGECRCLLSSKSTRVAPP